MRKSLPSVPHEEWERVLDLLNQMQSVFQEFLGLLRKEERVLQSMNRQGIADITEKKEQVLEEMCRYEQQVMALLGRLAGPENTKQLGRWLKLSAQPVAATVNAKLRDVFELAKFIQVQGKKNEATIRRSQHVVREAINLIYSGLGTGPVYQGSGTLQFSSVPGSVNLHG